MTNRELINLLLNYPMDIEVAIGLPNDDNELEIKVWDINTADTIEVENEPVLALFWEYAVDPKLN